VDSLQRVDPADPTEMAPDGLPVMATAPGFLIRRAQQMHISLWMRHVGPTLTAVQFGVLLVLAQQHELDQTSVAELMSLDKNNAADVLRRMRSRGFVTRTRDPNDGRRMVTRLTEAGSGVLLRAAPEVSQVQDQLLSVLNPEERNATLNLLRRVAYCGMPTRGGVPPAAHETPLRLHTAPGHLIRRSQQLHTMYWADEVSDELTSPQFSVLLVLHRELEVSQALLGTKACLDRATCADVVSRLHQRGLLHRTPDDVDGRRHKLSLSAAGRSALYANVEGLRVVQRRLLAPLSAVEVQMFITMMTKVVSDASAVQVSWR